VTSVLNEGVGIRQLDHDYLSSEDCGEGHVVAKKKGLIGGGGGGGGGGEGGFWGLRLVVFVLGGGYGGGGGGGGGLEWRGAGGVVLPSFFNRPQNFCPFPKKS